MVLTQRMRARDSLPHLQHSTASREDFEYQYY